MKVPDILLYGGLAVAGYYAWKQGYLDDPIAAGQKIIDDLFGKIGGGGNGGGNGGGGNGDGDGDGDGDGGGSGGGGGTGTPQGATGDCNAGPYKSTGKTVSTTQRGPTTRHYASGKADDKTIEKNAKSIPFKNYQFVNYVTVSSIEHDDTVSVKYGGTHMGSGWYDHGISFNSGQGCLGTEKKHPSTQLCVVKGSSIGKIVGKKLGIAGVLFGNDGGGGKSELWADIGGGWKKLAEGNNVGGFRPNAAQDEAQLRIDGFNATPNIHCSVVQEIAVAAGSFTPTTQSKFAMLNNPWPAAYQVTAVNPDECGYFIPYETTSIDDIKRIQQGLRMRY